ncbi:MAG: M24 family metallopeptidase [Vampirovibrionales bacterium]|nr:M24 family metallopeptidase [Vampirovibrionales bacterium]
MARGLQALLEAFREAMRSAALDAFIVPTADAHLSEYVAPSEQYRRWLTGFDGSAGDLLVTQDAAWLLVDSRYHEQAEAQVDASLFKVVKLGLPNVPELPGLIKQLAQQKPGLQVGYNPRQISARAFLALKAALSSVQWQALPHFLPELRQSLGEAMPFEAQPCFVLSDAVSGQSVPQKLAAVRALMAAESATCLPLVKLDEIAWLFNLRGQDVPHNPVATAYALITPDQAWYLAATPELPETVLQHLRAANVSTGPLDSFWPLLAQLAAQAGSKPWLDAANMNQAVISAVGTPKMHVSTLNPVAQLKAVKNPAELNGMRAAGRCASVAIIRLLAWLAEQGQTSEALASISEADVAQQLAQFYKSHPACTDLSFPSIVGFGANGAIVHYSHPSPQVKLAPGQLLLIDSGGQYLSDVAPCSPDAPDAQPFMGTTDATRTVLTGAAFTQATPAQQQRYTTVLKALIAGFMQVFPVGTHGAQIDGVIRSPLWQARLDYGHGTGHGVGAFLNVHEGPNGIHKRAQTALQPGMVTSIEPGYYASGWGGIRLENLSEVVPCPEDAAWLKFEPINWAPFDPALIDASALTGPERRWLSAYHQAIWQNTSPELNAQAQAWLRTQVDFFEQLG